MSKTIQCPDCGQPMDVPAFEGDGVYTQHCCDLDVLRSHQRREQELDLVDLYERWGGS
jgi:hypothetical protein